MGMKYVWPFGCELAEVGQHVRADVGVEAVDLLLIGGDVGVQRLEHAALLEQLHALGGDVGAVDRLTAGQPGRDLLEHGHPGVGGGVGGERLDRDAGLLGEGSQVLGRLGEVLGRDGQADVQYVIGGRGAPAAARGSPAGRQQRPGGGGHGRRLDPGGQEIPAAHPAEAHRRLAGHLRLVGLAGPSACWLSVHDELSFLHADRRPACMSPPGMPPVTGRILPGG